MTLNLVLDCSISNTTADPHRWLYPHNKVEFENFTKFEKLTKIVWGEEISRFYIFISRFFSVLFFYVEMSFALVLS